ncbi:MAG TPA: TPM domain-containing protein [Casimicrobiaceae bacterium]|nr:TPM domain-containing protein [Casimicrobiaceae bacterium]
MRATRAGRLWRHLVTDHWSARRAFPRAALEHIEKTIAAGERGHSGQVRFVVEAALQLHSVLRGESPRERALQVFGRLRIWDTEDNCGVLVYLLLADRAVEIVADRGIHRRVGDASWQAICRRMEQAYRERKFEEGAIAGLEAINALLAQHFPRTAPGENELPDRPLVL